MTSEIELLLLLHIIIIIIMRCGTRRFRSEWDGRRRRCRRRTILAMMEWRSLLHTTTVLFAKSMPQHDEATAMRTDSTALLHVILQYL